jgi:protocatechuate 3,4-dioxygenase beta subunit
MQLFFELCSQCGLHKFESDTVPEKYGWRWVYVDERYPHIQHSLEKRSVRGRQEITKEDLLKLQSMLYK